MTRPSTATSSRRRRRLTLALAAVAGAGTLTTALVGAAMTTSGEPAPPSTVGTAAAAVSTGAATGDVVTARQATAIDGREVSVPGGHPTVVFFMAAWCASCMEGAQAMADLEDDYAGAVDFVAINLTPTDTVSDVADFAHAAGASHPYVIDNDATFLTQYAVSALDTTVVLDTSGRVLDRIDGRPLNTSELRSFLDTALT